MVSPYTGAPTSPVARTGDVRIDALLQGDRWGNGRSDDVLDYSFPGAASVWAYGYGDGEPAASGYRSLDSVEQAWFRYALQSWSEVANVRFREVSDSRDSVGDIRTTYAVLPMNTYAWAYYPSQTPEGGDIWLNPLHDWTLGLGRYSFTTLLHEIGHALGIKHPFEGDVVLPAGQDTRQYTVMSYAPHPWVDVEPSTPMLYDILALQHLYGANYQTRADDTRYVSQPGELQCFTIWDGGGIDTVDCAAQLAPVDIDLREGSFSSIGVTADGAPARENIAVAFGVTIENAIGGSGSDRITGNAVGNVLEGGAGDDTLLGGGGDDTLLGGGGADLLLGDSGSDSLLGSSGTDTLQGADSSDTLRGGGGSDLLLGDGGSDFLAGGDGFDVLSGAAGADSLLGAPGNDTLDGGGGDDWLYGGPGADYFVFSTLTDGLSEIDTIFGYWKAGGDAILLPHGAADIVAEAFAGTGWLLTLGGDGDVIRLENVVDAGVAGTILDDLLFA